MQRYNQSFGRKSVSVEYFQHIGVDWGEESVFELENHSAIGNNFLQNAIKKRAADISTAARSWGNETTHTPSRGCAEVLLMPKGLLLLHVFGDRTAIGGTGVVHRFTRGKNQDCCSDGKDCNDLLHGLWRLLICAAKVQLVAQW